MSASRKRVLISGAGIAGPALAWWLDHFGFEPSIVEVAPHFRTGGYMIDFWGKGFDLVDRMGLLPEVLKSGYRVQEVRFVGSDGRRVGGFSTEPFWRTTDGRFTSLPRSELAGIIWRALPSRLETRFGDQVERIEEEGSSVRVHFQSSRSESFDLVIGADGLHSRIRHLLMGPEERFETFLGYAFAAFTVRGFQWRTPDVYMTYGVPGRQASRFTMRDDRTLILFIWRQDKSALPHTEAERRGLLKQLFGELGWECAAMIGALEGSDDLYVDTVSQIALPRWSSGHVGLVGDAAWAPSFLAGEGCGLGIIGAYVLAGELARADGDPKAFLAYERRLRDFMSSKQRMAAKFAGAFCPETRLGLFLRNHVASLLNVSMFADWALSRALDDDIDLPDYRSDQ